MAFIRQKGPYHYVVDSVREGDQVKQTVLGYLGKFPSLDYAIWFLKGRIRAYSKLTPQVRNRQAIQMHRETVQRWKRDLENKITLRKLVGGLLSPEEEKQILKRERAQLKRICALDRALLKLQPKVGAR